MNKLAILGTTEAREITWSGNEIVSARASDLLIRLLAEDYEILIVTARETFSQHDVCWQNWISPPNIYHPSVGDPENKHCANNPAVVRLWSQIFERFKLSTPVEPYDPTNWLHWRWCARDQGVIIG